MLTLPSSSHPRVLKRACAVVLFVTDGPNGSLAVTACCVTVFATVQLGAREDCVPRRRPNSPNSTALAEAIWPWQRSGCCCC